MQIKYILSDLDGVIRKFPAGRDDAIEQKYGLRQGSLGQTAFETAILTKVICGEISDEAWRAEITKRLAAAHPQAQAAAAVAEWSHHGEVDHEYLHHLETRFPGIPVALLTNATSRLNKDLAALNLVGKFQRIFNTSEIGLCKPDKRLFTHVLGELACAAQEVLFIDDSPGHVEAAKELGICGYHYRSLGQLKEDI